MKNNYTKQLHLDKMVQKDQVRVKSSKNYKPTKKHTRKKSKQIWKIILQRLKNSVISHPQSQNQMPKLKVK